MRSRLHALYPALSALPEVQQDRLFAAANLLQLPAGAAIFSENQPCGGFPLILEGSIKVIKQASNGRELLLYRVGPGDSCIISSSCLLGKTAYNARGVTETELTLCVLPVVEFHRLLIEQAAFRDFVFHLFTERIGELMQLVEEVAFARLDQRLDKCLLAHPVDVLHLTHQQLADELGSVREIVSRLLKGFAGQGLVSLGREQITLLDRAGLRALVTM